MKIFKSKIEGFTLIELLISISIMIILTAVAIGGSRFGREHYALSRSAHQLAQDLRRAEEMAVSSKELIGGEIPNGYGIYLEKDSNFYILFADLDSDFTYDSGEKIEDPIDLERKVKISHISEGFSHLNIVFSPPNPDVTIKSDLTTTTEVTITLSLESYPGDQKLVSVNKVGLIAVE